MNTGTAKGVCSWLTSWPRKRVNIVGCLTWINMWIKIGFGKQKKAALRRTVSTTTKTSSMLESWRNATWSQICYLLNIDWHLGYPQFWLICSFSAYWINGPPLTIRSAPNLWSLQTLLFFRFHFCGSSWVRSGGGLGYLQSKFVGQNCTYKLSTVNLNDASFGACNHFSSLRDSVIKKSMCRSRRGWPGFQQGLTSKLSAQSSDRCYRTDFAGDASGEQAMQFANRTCDPKSVFRAIFAKEQIPCCCYFGANLG